MGFRDFLLNVGQGLNEFSENAPRYNEETELYKKYGSQWRDYAAAARARLAQEIAAPERQRLQDERVSRESDARIKMAQSQFDEQQQEHARKRLDDATEYVVKGITYNADGTVNIPPLDSIPETLKAGIAGVDLERVRTTAGARAADNERRRVAELERRKTDEAEKNKRERGESDAQMRTRLRLESEESDRRSERDRNAPPKAAKPLTYSEAVRTARTTLGRRATADQIKAEARQLMADEALAAQGPDAAEAIPGTASAPDLLMRQPDEGTDFSRLGAGSPGAARESQPPVGARTAVNPKTKQRIYLDPKTQQWVPY